MALNDPALAQIIARRLAETANRQKVIEELCIERRLHWDDARQLVDEVLDAYHLEITRQQSPILALLAFAIFVGGAALTSWHLLGILSHFSPRTSELIKLFNLYSGLFQSLTNLPETITWFVTGFAMMAGSMWGMKEVWLAVLDAWDKRTLPVTESLPLPEPAPVKLESDADSPQAVYTSNGWLAPQPDSPDALDVILEHLKDESDVPAVVARLESDFGLSQREAYALIRKALASMQQGRLPRTSPAWMFAALAAVITGAVWVLQFSVTVSAYLSTRPRPVADVFWGTLTRLTQINDYIVQFPLGFGFFSLGLILLLGGLYILGKHWPTTLGWFQHVTL